MKYNLVVSGGGLSGVVNIKKATPAYFWVSWS